AVRAAVEARAAVEDLGEELAVRIALDSGEVVAAGIPGQDRFVTGSAVGAAAHLEQAAQPGEILLGEEARRLVRDAVRAERVERADLRGWRVDELREGAAPFSRRLDAPLVGRVNELARLRIAFERSRDERRCRVVVVAGEAGIGK